MVSIIELDYNLINARSGYFIRPATRQQMKCIYLTFIYYCLNPTFLAKEPNIYLMNTRIIK